MAATAQPVRKSDTQPMGPVALVVEDSPSMRQLIAFALSRIRGLQVLEAADGSEALRKLDASHVDVLLTDINMPEMDGFKLIERVRADSRFADLPVAVITTEGERERERALAAGANAFIAKPVQAAQVVQVVKELLEIG